MDFSGRKGQWTCLAEKRKQLRNTYREISKAGGYDRYIFVDWAMAGSLENTEELQKVVLSYDQACKYSILFRARMEQRFPHLRGQFDKFQYLVNKAHLPNHIEECVLMFNPNYTEGSGREDGEENERIWSVQNANASTTREMSSGHRRDALNDALNWWNFVKAMRIGNSSLIYIPGAHRQALVDSINKKSAVALEQHEQSTIDFHDLRNATDPQNLAEWDKLDETARRGEDGIVESVFRMPYVDGKHALTGTRSYSR